MTAEPGLTRQAILGGAAAGVGALAFGRRAALGAKPPSGPPPFDHVVVVMMENRSSTTSSAGCRARTDARRG
jgi:hypothetical protein